MLMTGIIPTHNNNGVRVLNALYVSKSAHVLSLCHPHYKTVGGCEQTHFTDDEMGES